MRLDKLATLMALDVAAFSAKTSGFKVLETRDGEPTLGSIGEAVDAINVAFEEYKKTNDAKLEALKEGKSTADFDVKLAKIDGDLDQLQELKAKLEKVETKLSRPGDFEGKGRQDGELQEEVEYRDNFFAWMRDPKNSDLHQKCIQSSKELEAKRAEIGLSRRSTQTSTTSGASGGLAVPHLVEQSILQIGLDSSPMRQLATVRQVGSTDYHELVDTGGATFEWVGEEDDRNQTDTPDIVEITPTYGGASAKPQATEESLDDIFFNVEDWLIDSARKAIVQGEGAAFISGNGVKKPTGFLAGPAPVADVDSTRSFGTLQYVAGGAAAALPTDFDKYQDMVYSLRALYRGNAKWLGSKLVYSAMRKVKNGQGDYMWQPAVTAGQPDVFMGYGVYEDENMPAVAANAFPLAFGDFKEGYLITDLVGLRVTRDEITKPGFVKFYVRKRVGGILRNTEAIKLLKVASS